MTISILLLGAFLAGLLKVGFGQGAGFLALPVSTLAVPARFANGVLAPLLSLGDVVSVPAYWRKWNTRLLVTCVPGQIAGTIAGAAILARMSDVAARRAIGALLIAAVLNQLWMRRRAAAASSAPSHTAFSVPVAVTVSIVTGITSAIAQLGSGFLSVYLVRLGTPKAAIVPTLNIMFFFSNIAKIAMYWWYGIVDWETLFTDAWLAPALIGGALVGLSANRRLSQRTFENALLAFALAAAVKLLLW